MKKFLITIALVAMLTATQVSANKYNEMGYVDVNGRTVADLAEAQGVTVEEFLEMYSLPEDMPADTSENAAFYNIPTGEVAEMYGMGFEELKLLLNLGDEITEETPWGVAEGEALLADYIGVENLDSFKAEYGFGDEVTADTKWKEVRTVVDEAKKLEFEQAQEESQIVFTEPVYEDDNDYNKYNEEDVINFANSTLQEMADAGMMTTDEFKAQFGIPEDMPGNTNLGSAMDYSTLGKVAELYGVTAEEYIEEMKPIYKGEEELTPNTFYSAYEDNITLRDYVGEEYIDEYLEQLDLGEDVTADTLYGDVKIEVGRKQLAANELLNYFTGDEVLVMVNGKYLDFDAVPEIVNDHVMVPMRAVFENLGANVNWMGETQTIFAVKGTDIVTMQIGQDFFFKNEEKIALDVPTYAAFDRTYVPINMVSEAFGVPVFYNENTQTVVVH